MRKAILVTLVLSLLASCVREETVEIPEAAPGARPGGTLTVGITQPQSLDPGLTDGLDPSSIVTRTLCDTLIDLDPRTGEARPAIAESWQPMDGGQRFVVRLRRGVRFHDGREIQADDVVWSLARLARQDFASPVASVLEPIWGFDVLHGDAEITDAGDRERLRGLRVVEPYSFEILLAYPQADFIRALAHPATAPVSRAAAEGDPDAFAQRPVCAGPYEMTEPWTSPETPVVLRRFADYHGANLAYTGGGAGYPDEIRFGVFAAPADAVQAFIDGGVDLVHVPEDLVGVDVDAREVTGPTPTLEYIGFPLGAEGFVSSSLRTAFSMALDRRRIVDEVYGGRRTPARSFLPPATGDVHRREACRFAPETADIPSARRLFAVSGADLGDGFTLLYNDEFDHARLAADVAAQWSEAFGITVETAGMPWDRYITLGTEPPGFQQPFRMSWAPQYASADTYLHPLFHSENVGRQNLTRFAMTAFDNPLDRRARRASAVEDLVVEYQELEDLVCNLMPAVPIVFGARTYLVRDDTLGSAIDHPMNLGTGLIALRELYVR